METSGRHTQLLPALRPGYTEASCSHQLHSTQHNGPFCSGGLGTSESVLAGCWLQWPKPLSAPRGSCEQSCSNRGSCGFCHLRGVSKQAFPVSLLPQDFPKDRCLFQELCPFLSPLPAIWRLEDLLPFIIYLLTVYHVPLIRHHY